ncbi:MAG: alpha/beta hydrolase, partial [Firmicutes bacterium]|nr:alpha/beta hydrolase [Bacillota bacterium]
DIVLIGGNIMSVSIFNSYEGEKKLLKLYDQALIGLGLEYEENYVKTRYGKTHILTTGPEKAPPVVLLQGGNTVSPITLSWFLPLTKQFRVYAPDTIGHPGKSEQVRISPSDDSFGKWTIDILDGLGLSEAIFIGPSYGAGIILRTASFAPERIKKAVLYVPSGIASGSIAQMVRKVVLPMLMYKMYPSEERLIKAVRPMFTGEIDEITKQVTGAVFRYVKLETNMPRLAKKEELIKFKSPTIVIAGDKDIFFPAQRVIPRAKDIITNLVGAESIPDLGHLPSKDNLNYINDLIIRFIKKEK